MKVRLPLGILALAPVLLTAQQAGQTHKAIVVSVDGVAVRQVDEDLFAAIQAHDLPRVKKLLAKGANPNANQANGLRPLLDVDVHDPSCILIASTLLKAGAHINYRQPDQSITPLTSFYMQNAEYAKFLLAHGADPNLIGFGGETPLEQAVQANNLAVVKALLAAKAGLGKRSIGPKGERPVDPEHTFQPGYKDSGQTALFGLANRWSTPMYKFLLSKGVDPKAKDDNGWTLLDTCIVHGNPEGETYLLSHGAKPNEPSNQGYTALHLAMNGALFPYPQFVAPLMAHGADPALKTHQGKTAEDLLRARVVDFLGKVRLVTLDEVNQRYLDDANQILKLIDPSVAPIANPKIDTSRWTPLRSSEGEPHIEYRVIRGATKTQLVLRFEPIPEPVTIKVSKPYLDYYESTLPGPFTYKLPPGKRLEETIDFPPAAGQAGNLIWSYDYTGPSMGGGATAGDQVPMLTPDLLWVSGPADLPGIGKVEAPGYLFYNRAPDRTVEVEIESGPGAKETFQLSPHGKKLIPGKAQTIKYRSRLLPNQRWISGAMQGEE